MPWLGQAPLRHLVEKFGWRTVIGSLGIVSLVLAVLLFYIVPRRPRSAPNQPQHETPSTFAGVVAVIANPQSWACAGIGFGMASIMLAFAGLWAVPWLRDIYGYIDSTAATVASMLFLGWAIGAR